ncbi:MAG: hypothetical protein K0U98_13580 [Deltaproteobacteria bacterium]|nr:hypothetical protein [Deltaproteobacteria bacterium]
MEIDPDNGEDTFLASVFLVAGMTGTSTFFETFDTMTHSNIDEELFIDGDPQLVTLDSVDPLNGLQDLKVDPGPENVFICPRVQKPGLDPGGTRLGGGIDPGDGQPHIIPLTVITARDFSHQDFLEVVLGSQPSNTFEVHLETTLDGGETTATYPVPFDGGMRVEINWWRATSEASKDGGALLFLDGALVGELQALDNYYANLETWTWGLEGGTGWVGPMHFDDIQIWDLPRRPRLQPLFADFFETGDFRLWDSQQCGPVPVGGESGQYRLILNPAFPDCFVDHRFDWSVSHYQARMTVDLSLLSMPAFERIFLLRGYSDAYPSSVLRLQAQWTGSKFQLRANVRDDEGALQHTPWVSAPANGPFEVELQAWTSDSGSSNGGLRISVDGAVAEVLDLNNSSRSLDKVELGVASVGAGSSGEIILDDFEEWR